MPLTKDDTVDSFFSTTPLKSVVKRDTDNIYYYDEKPSDRKTRLLDPKYCKYGEPTATEACNTQSCPSELTKYRRPTSFNTAKTYVRI